MSQTTDLYLETERADNIERERECKQDFINEHTYSIICPEESDKVTSPTGTKENII